MKLASFFATTALAENFQFNIDGTVYEGHKSSLRLSYWETKKHCDDMGGGWQLPTPTNSQENRATFEIAKKAGNIYLGISQYASENAGLSAKWYNVYEQSPIRYSSWMRGQPNNYKGTEDFAVMVR